MWGHVIILFPSYLFQDGFNAPWWFLFSPVSCLSPLGCISLNVLVPKVLEEREKRQCSARGFNNSFTELEAETATWPFSAPHTLEPVGWHNLFWLVREIRLLLYNGIREEMSRTQGIFWSSLLVFLCEEKKS